MITIREITLDDAGRFLDLCRQLDNETSFMMLEAGERRTTLDEQRRILEDVLASPNSTILVALGGGELAGYVGAFGGEFRRNRHSAYVVAGVRQQYAGQGIGTRLFRTLDAWAVEHGLHRLELTVIVHNQPGIGLYRKMGYEIEGTKRHSLVVDGEYVDELHMAKLL